MTTEKEVQEDIQEEEDAKVYEVGFHVVPTMAEDDVVSVVNAVQNAVESVSGTVVSEGAPVKVQLAYPMDHIVENKKSIFDSAYFGWIKFEVVPQNVLQVKDILEKNKDIFRFIIINTVKEDTLLQKQDFKIKRAKVLPKTEKNKEQKKEISVVEVDKAIEELVVE